MMAEIHEMDLVRCDRSRCKASEDVQFASALGWTVTPDGEDLCPIHGDAPTAEKPKRSYTPSSGGKA